MKNFRISLFAEHPLTTFNICTFLNLSLKGKRKMLEGFVRWVQKSDVGLSQTITVTDVLEEEPTGLYDDFYVKIRD